MTTLKIAISGVGVAGPTLAYWLARAGHEPTLIEVAPKLRTGGYVIDFWGLGYEVARRMGIETTIQQLGYHVQSFRSVTSDGHTRATLDTAGFHRVTKDKFTSLPRGDLAATIYATIGGEVETVFGDSITAVTEHEDGVCLSFLNGPTREFDLIVAPTDCTPTCVGWSSGATPTSSTISDAWSPPPSSTAISPATTWCT